MADADAIITVRLKKDDGSYEVLEPIHMKGEVIKQLQADFHGFINNATPLSGSYEGNEPKVTSHYVRRILVLRFDNVASVS